MGGEESQDRRGAGDREVVPAADSEDRVPPEHQVAEGAAANTGEAGEKQEPHDVELSARCDETPVSAKMKTAIRSRMEAGFIAHLLAGCTRPTHRATDWQTRANT